MKESSAATQFNNSSFGTAQSAILMGTTVKNIAEASLTFGRNFSMILTGISEAYNLPNFTLTTDPALGNNISVDKTTGSIVTKIGSSLNKPNPETVSQLLSVIGQIQTDSNDYDKQSVQKGVEWVNSYHADVTARFLAGDIDTRKEIMLPLGKTAFIYLQSNVGKFVDDIKSEDEFLNEWLSVVNADQGNFDTIFNAAFIHVIFGDQRAQDYFNIYIALCHQPMVDDHILDPATADFMSAYLMGCTAGI